jgi:molybdopterin synthase catalytic subunit
VSQTRLTTGIREMADTADTGVSAAMADTAGTADTADTGGVAEVVLAEICESRLSVDEVLDAVRHPDSGAIATFVGVVRESDHGRKVEALDYTCHPSAPQVLAEVARQVAVAAGVIRVGVTHRVGHLDLGDIAVVVAVSAAHRGDALDACRELIDAVKATVPIWKHQVFQDGSDEWVGTP